MKLNFSKRPATSTVEPKSLPVHIYGSIDSPLIRLDCRSDLSATGTRLEFREIGMKVDFKGSPDHSSLKTQIGSISLITFQASKVSEIQRSIKNIGLKVQNASLNFARLSKPLFIDAHVEVAQGGFGTVDFYIIIISLQHLIRIAKAAQTKGHQVSKPLSPVQATLLIDRVDLKWTLAPDVIIKIHANPLKGSLSEWLVQLGVEELGMTALVDPVSHRYESLGTLRDLEVQVAKAVSAPSDVCPFSISVHGKYLFVTVPTGYKLEFVIENMINLGKIFKNLAMQHLDFKPTDYYSSGRTKIDPADIPVIKMALDELIFCIQDDPFEMLLSRNYALGYEEQSSRVARDKAFEKQVALRKDSTAKMSERAGHLSK
jgi:hypothetical protein